MRVKVKVFASLRDLMPREMDVDVASEASIATLLDRLCEQYPGLYGEIFEGPGKTKPYVNILKNGRNISFIDDLRTILEGGDTVAIFPPVAGG